MSQCSDLVRRRPCTYTLYQRHRSATTVRRVSGCVEVEHAIAELKDVRSDAGVLHNERLVGLQTELYRLGIRPVLAVLDGVDAIEVHCAIAGILRVLIRVQRQAVGADFL